MISANTYTLKGLLRGLRGTEQAKSTHAAAERFVLLNTVGLARVPLVNADIGRQLYYKPVSFGRTLNDAVANPFTNTAAGLKPLAPVLINAARQASGDLIITWTRRSRLDAAWRNNADVPIGETAETYELELMNAGFVIRRTVTVTGATTYTYTAALQTTDGGVLTAGQFNVRIYQISSVVGRGTGSPIANF